MIWKKHKPDYKPNWDLDNLAVLWIKIINDTLTQKGIIVDDTVEYVQGLNARP